jgi:integrase
MADRDQTTPAMQISVSTNATPNSSLVDVNGVTLTPEVLAAAAQIVNSVANRNPQIIHNSFAQPVEAQRYNPPYTMDDLSEGDYLEMARRKNGEGSVYFNEKRQCWQVAFSIGTDEDGTRRRKILSAPTEPEAWEAYLRFIECGVAPKPETQKEQVAKVSKVTFEQVAYEYLNGERVHEDRGFETTLGIVKVIVKGLGKEYIDEITPGATKVFLADIINTKYSKGDKTSYYSQKYLGKVFYVLKSIFEHAVDNNYIVQNPMRKLKKKAYKSKQQIDKKPKAFTTEEIVTLNEVLQGHPMYHTITTIMMYCGLRPGEVHALKWDDFDYQKRVVHVLRTLSFEAKYDADEKRTKEHEPKFKNLKNDDNNEKEIPPYRDIPINDKVINAVQSWRKYLETTKCNSRVIYYLDEEINEYYYIHVSGRNVGKRAYISCEKAESLPTLMEQRLGNKIGNHSMSDCLFSKQLNGEAALPDYFVQEYGKILKANSLDCHQYKVYRFRHTYCTVSLKEMNNDIKAVQVLMGDNDPTMIMQVYHTIRNEEVIRDAADKVLPGLERYSQESA